MNVECRNAKIHHPALTNPSVPFFADVGSYELGNLKEAQFKTAMTYINSPNWMGMSPTSDYTGCETK